MVRHDGDHEDNAAPAGGRRSARISCRRDDRKRLRTERRKGNLAVMMLAGKEFTTLAAIEDMLCRAQRKAPASTSASSETPRLSGSSETDRHSIAQAAGRAKLNELSKRLREKKEASAESDDFRHRRRKPTQGED